MTFRYINNTRTMTEDFNEAPVAFEDKLNKLQKIQSIQITLQKQKIILI